jgi:hypothetical protein
MLNEFKEYEDYTSLLVLSVNSEKPRFKSGEIYGRLLLESITKRFGIDRALTIIARRFIYHDKNDISKVIKSGGNTLEDTIHYVRDCLLAWCSNKSLSNETPKELVGKFGNGRFYDYMKDSHLAFTNLIKRIELGELKATKRQLSDYTSSAFKIESSINKWDSDYFPGLIKNEFYSIKGMKNKFDNKILTLDIIIANALNEGPLRNRSVVIPKTTFKLFYEVFEKPYKAFITDFLYTLSLYLVQKKESETDYQIINDANISNWLRKKSYSRSFKAFHDKLSQKELFAQEIVFNVTKKIFISDLLTESLYVCDSVNLNSEDIIITDDIPQKELKKIISDAYNFYKM